jgi:hypothetical protein
MVTLGMGAIAGMMAEFQAEMRLQSQGIRTCRVDYACGLGKVAREITVCVPKEMLPAEIQQKINAESLTSDPGWKVSIESQPCNDHPDRMHCLLVKAE